MKAVSSFVFKALRVGPLPYLGLSVAVIGVGAVLQMRGDAALMTTDGRTVFGTFAQIGGCIGLVGLATMVFNGLPPEPGRGADDGLPQSARAARMEGADPLPSPTAKAVRPKPSAAAMASSPAAKTGMRMARQFGMQAIRQLARRGS